MFNNLRTVQVLLRRPVKGWVVLAILGSVVLAALDTLGVAAMLPLMDLFTAGDTTDGISGYVSRLLGTDDLQTLILAMAGLVAAAFVLKTIFSVLFRWWLLGHTTRLTAEASAELMRLYVLAPYSEHKQRTHPEIYRNIGAAIPQSFNQVALGLLTLIADLLTLVAMAVVLLVVSPLATILAVGVLGLSVLVIQRTMSRALTRAGEVMSSAELDGWVALLPGIDGFRDSRLTSSGGQFVEGYYRAKIRYAGGLRRMSLFTELPKYVLEIAFIIAIAGMSALLFATGTPEAAVSTLGVFAAASLRMLPTLNRVTATTSAVRSGSVGLQILADAVRKLDTEEVHSENRRSNVDYAGDLTVENVVYQYPDANEPVLNGLSISIPKGETTALVGSSGAGKSTLLDIILGLVTPQSGGVRVGGRSISDDLASWYDTLGVVPQDVFLTNATLRENIAYGVSATDIDDSRIATAVADARLTEFVADLPSGLDTVLGERGVRLSGGQRQRVGIARALYRQPSFLILDEATSALDNLTERQITETIDALHGRMTVIIVAHRLSTIKNADQIVFLARGHVEAVGTFSQLRRSTPEFEQLVELGKLV